MSGRRSDDWPGDNREREPGWACRPARSWVLATRADAADTWIWVAGFAVIALAEIWLIAKGLAERSVGAGKTAQAEGLS